MRVEVWCSPFPPSTGPTSSLGGAQDTEYITLSKKRFFFLITLDTFPHIHLSKQLSMPDQKCTSAGTLDIDEYIYLLQKPVINTGYRPCSDTWSCSTTVPVKISARKCALKSQEILSCLTWRQNRHNPLLWALLCYPIVSKGWHFTSYKFEAGSK